MTNKRFENICKDVLDSLGFFKRYIPISCIICCISCFFPLHNFRKIPEVANGEDKSGTTAICVLISENYTIFSNCGDSRGVLSAEGSKPVLVTQVDFSFFKLLSYVTILSCTCFANMKCLKFRIISIFSSFLSKFRITNLQIRQNWSEFKTPEVP